MLAACLSLGCLWDRDTVVAELKGMPELQDVIAGRFERNPDLYYEMRLARYQKVDRNPFAEEYFDLAVASDRLGRHDDAIEWIAKFDRDPAVRNEPNTDSKDLSYKRAANLGTFYIHRGLKKGEGGLGDLKKGLGLIEESIEINPEAHFGREKVQAALVRQMIWRQELDAQVQELRDKGDEEGAFDVLINEPPATGLTVEEIKEGVIGLMVLGNAWEAPVAWEWLAGTYDSEDSHARTMVIERIREINPDYGFIEELPDPLVNVGYMPRDEERTEEVYRHIRANGEDWRANRQKFMLAKLNSGQHPDTDKDFWDGYQETPPYEIVETVPGGVIDPQAQLAVWIKVILGSCVGILVFVVGGIVWFVRRKNGKKVATGA